MINRIRQLTPLSIRQKVGPYLGYAMYWYRTRVRGNTWEPAVLSPHDTLVKIRNENLSIIRFGDGELSLIQGADLGFQKHDANLAKLLRDVITTDQPGLMIGIPGIFGRLEHFSPLGFWFEIHHLFRYGDLWKQLTKPDRVYGDAFITRPYLSYRDKSAANDIYCQIKSLWSDKNVILIEGQKSRLGVGNDLFKGASLVRRVLGPVENAFSKTGAIIEKVEALSKPDLVLLSLGPAAKVIGYELFKKGYRVLDIGHLDMEYEMFLRGSDRLVAVPHKYFNEIDARDPEECYDPQYVKEVVATII